MTSVFSKFAERKFDASGQAIKNEKTKPDQIIIFSLYSENLQL